MNCRLVAFLAALLAAGWLSATAEAQGPSFAEIDQAMTGSIVAREQESWQAALAIWQWAEPGYQEHRSAALLADLLESKGFRLKRQAADIPTAFIAEIGGGKPVIGLIGEYDALPGLSQQAEPERRPASGSDYGHGCGHHLFGVASASAAIALAERIAAGQLAGTVRFYGCPAEEGGSAKAFMVRAGLFADCDAVLHWHPGSKNIAGDRSCLARAAVKFRFHGVSSHAAGSPEQGRSALDAVELTNHAAELLREHTPDLTRIHHVVTAGGSAPNVVPEFCETWFYVRHPKAEVVRQLMPRLMKCAQAGALATETRLEVIDLGGTLELLPNDTLAGRLKQQLADHNDLSWTAEELAFAARIQATLAEPKPLDSIGEIDDQSGEIGKGSTDVGDVSWAAPTAGFSTACWVPGTPGHSWQAVAAGGTSIGRKGMQLAAKVLAASAAELMLRPELVAAAKAEHQQRLEGREYRPLIGPDLAPPLDYRSPPRAAAVAE